MKKVSFLLISFVLMSQVYAKPNIPGFTDQFTVNFPTFNGSPIPFSMSGTPEKHSALAFQNKGCSMTDSGTACNFNIWDKGNSWFDADNVYVFLSARNGTFCQLEIFDGSVYMLPNLVNYSCVPNTLKISNILPGTYPYRINVTASK